MEELDTAYVTFDGADLEAVNAVEKRDKKRLLRVEKIQGTEYYERDRTT